MGSVLVAAMLSLQTAIPLIDMVAQPSKSPPQLAIGGKFEGEVYGVKLPPKPKPPLEIRLESISTLPDRPQFRIVEAPSVLKDQLTASLAASVRSS